MSKHCSRMRIWSLALFSIKFAQMAEFQTPADLMLSDFVLYACIAVPVIISLLGNAVSFSYEGPKVKPSARQRLPPRSSRRYTFEF